MAEIVAREIEIDQRSQYSEDARRTTRALIPSFVLGTAYRFNIDVENQAVKSRSWNTPQRITGQRWGSTAERRRI